MYLLWAKLFELVMRQVDFGAAHGPLVSLLHRSIPVITTLAEDKASGGILGAIGLGKRSQLSHRLVDTPEPYVVNYYHYIINNSYKTYL